MQDKEIDHLFRSGLNDLEVEPSARVWTGINEKLAKRKHPVIKYLSLAASLLILLSVGAYFILQTNDDVKKPVKVAVVKSYPPATNTAVNPEIAKAVITAPKAEKAIAINRKITLRRLKPNKDQQQKFDSPVARVLVANEPEQQLAQGSHQTIATITAVVPDKNTAITEKLNVVDDTPLATQPDIPVEAIAATPAKKHRIRSLGDIINVVVSKVDKRKDKLIEFSSTRDEDESVISGLNLGFIKVKKEVK